MIDILIKNGHVIDPLNNTDEIKTIAIYNGKIVKSNDLMEAKHVIDATDRYVFPGLIDSHAHMFAEGTDIGIYPDSTYLPTGVTSAIDCTAGVSNYRIFRSSIIEKSKVRIKSFLQVCSAGLITNKYHECIDPKYFDEEKIIRIYRENKDNILGLKIRQGEEIANGLGIEPLKKTIAIAEKISCPVEVHCTNIPVSTCELLSELRPGDIFEHVYQGVKNTILDENGKLYECVQKSRENGILFDTGEGRKHADFDIMLSAMTQGFVADFCSTDLVLNSAFRRPIFSLPNLMSRYICMGIPIQQVVQMTTQNPAKLMNMEGEIGCLSIGSYADISIFKMINCKQTYKDWKGSSFVANKLLKSEMTIKDGDIVYCSPDYIYEESFI